MKFFNKITYALMSVILCSGTCENYPQSEIDRDHVYRSYCLNMIKEDKVFEQALSHAKKKLYVYKNVQFDKKTKTKSEWKSIEKYDHENKYKKKLSSDFYEIVKLEDLEVEQLNINIDVTEDNEDAKIVLNGNIVFKSIGNNSNIKFDIDDELSLMNLMIGNIQRDNDSSQQCFYSVLKQLTTKKFNGGTVHFENKYIKKGENFFYADNAVTQCIPNSLLQGNVKITLTMPSKFHIANSTVNLKKQIAIGKDEEIDTYEWSKPKSKKYPGHMFLELNFDKDYKFDITQKFDITENNGLTGPMPFLNIDNIVSKVQFLNNSNRDISGKIASNMYQKDNIYIGKIFDNHIEIELPKNEKTLKIKYDIISHVGILKQNIHNIVIDFSNNETLRILANKIIDECNANDECDCVKATWLCHWVHDYIPYCSHVSSQKMSPLQLVYEKSGVCADFVMLFLGLCSSSGIKQLYDMCGYAQNKDKSPELHEWTCLYCPQCKKMVAFDPTWDLCYGLPPSHLAIRTKNRINEPTYSVKPQYSISYINNNKQEVYINELK